MGNFEHYPNRNSANATRSMGVSIRQSDTMGILIGIYREYFNDSKKAHLYYNEEDNEIGIEPTTSDDNAAYTVSTVGSGGSIGATSFINQHGLSHEETTKYSAEWDDDEEFIVVDLDDPL